MQKKIWNNKVGALSKLNRLQRLALLPMSPVRSNTPTAGMEILANVIPLTIHIQEMALRSFIRVKSHLPTWDNLGRRNLRGHLHKTMKLANKLNISLNISPLTQTLSPLQGELTRGMSINYSTHLQPSKKNNASG